MAFTKELMQSGMFLPMAQAAGGSVENNITATGAAQATAYALSKVISNVTTAAASTGVLLPASISQADSMLVRNGGANALTVYPSGTATVNGASSVSVAAGKTALVVCIDGTNFLALVGA